MRYEYETHGVCSRSISFDIDKDHIVSNIRFNGGCNGNTKGVASLAEGMRAEDIISRCGGIRCGMKSSSCPDQLAEALENALDEI